MDKKWLYCLLIPLFIGCVSMSNDWKEINPGPFKLLIPKQWDYKPQQGEDSFVGKIIGKDVAFYFDCSSHGYANHLLPSEADFLKQGDWKVDYACLFCKPGITYTANFNVKAEKSRLMKEKGITDSSLVKVEADPSYETKENIHKPTAEQHKKYPKADYIADMTYRDSTVYIPITIPQLIKQNNILIDSDSNYVYKTIWPKIAGRGMTGLYVHSRKSSFNFQINGENLSAKDQELALKAFKTIKFKDQ